ncbi:MAG: SDR family oxidoreductase [Acidimicrobiia bacterium]|nr:SDR family oxidoreductase [Acidimicrobiia bacterium]
MDLGIGGKRAAVAAGSAGLGLGAAQALAADGVHVAICGRSTDRLEAAAEAIRAGGGRVETVVADVGTAEGAADFVDRATDVLGGPPDILVANAGGPPPGTFASTTMEDYRTAVELSFLSTVAMCQRAVPPMQAAGWGRVVAITSVGARQPIGRLMASTAARAGLTGFLKVLATEVAPDGVTVNSVQPGVHGTDRLRSMAPDALASLRADVPSGRLGDPGDFGAVVAFLCSQQAGFVTGTALPVDGGATRGLP